MCLGMIFVLINSYPVYVKTFMFKHRNSVFNNFSGSTWDLYTNN